MKLYSNHESMSDGELLRNGHMLLMLTVILPFKYFFCAYHKLSVRCKKMKESLNNVYMYLYTYAICYWQ